MDSQAVILAAVAAHPADDTPRLAYADWLDDHAGDMPDPPAARLRAEFIRVQCEVARLEHLPSAELQSYANLYRRQDHILTHHRRALLGPLADIMGPQDAMYDRGFVSELRLDAHVFVEIAHIVAAIVPLPEVNVFGATPDQWFHGCPHLEVLTSVGYSTLQSNEAILMEAGHRRIPVWTRLRVLNMSGCGLVDVTLRGIAGSSAHPALTELDLSFNEVSDIGVLSLVESQLWPRLTVLILGGNPISDDGANFLADAPPTALEYLNVARTGITRHGQQRLLRRKGWKVDLF